MAAGYSRSSVSIFRLFLKMGGWIVILTGLLFLSLSMVSQSEAEIAQRLNEEGRAASAVVGDKWVTKSRNPDGSVSDVYWLALSFTARDGRRIDLKRYVGAREFAQVARGDRVDLVYLPDDPRVTELTPGGYRASSRMKQIVALALGLVWLGLLWLVGSWSVDAVRAREYGRRLQATVEEVRRGMARLNGQAGYRLIWRDAEGREGKSLLHDRATLSGYGKGDRIGIYRGVKSSWWEGDVGARGDTEPR